MISLYLILTSMGLLTAGNDPKHPHTSITRRLSSQSVHSIHNYKQPHSAISSHKNGQPEAPVLQITTQPTNYKQQRTVGQPAGGITVEHIPGVSSSMRNYKNQPSN